MRPQTATSASSSTSPGGSSANCAASSVAVCVGSYEYAKGSLPASRSACTFWSRAVMSSSTVSSFPGSPGGGAFFPLAFGGAGAVISGEHHTRSGRRACGGAAKWATRSAPRAGLTTAAAA
eukprot:1109208-Prymnesium_polylepis.1